jgi:hypothetical protein
LYVTYENGSGGSTPQSKDGPFDFKVGFNLHVINNSSHTAYDMEIVQPKGRTLIHKLKGPKNYNNLEKNKEVALECSYETTLDNTTGLEVRQGKRDIQTVTGLDNLEFVLKYRNEKGKWFYTHFRRGHDPENELTRSEFF